MACWPRNWRISGPLTAHRSSPPLTTIRQGLFEPHRIVIELLGILAGCLTTLCWVPQLVRTWRRETPDDISGMHLFT